MDSPCSSTIWNWLGPADDPTIVCMCWGISVMETVWPTSPALFPNEWPFRHASEYDPEGSETRRWSGRPSISRAQYGEERLILVDGQQLAITKGPAPGRKVPGNNLDFC